MPHSEQKNWILEGKESETPPKPELSEKEKQEKIKQLKKQEEKLTKNIDLLKYI